MKNYTFGWRLKELGYTEVPAEEYTDRQKDMSEYISVLSDAVKKAKCGWSGIEYRLMKVNNYAEPYMVLCVDGHGERWIPIDGNSKGCNLSVLGENLW
jgi:hypothetical protein